MPVSGESPFAATGHGLPFSPNLSSFMVSNSMIRLPLLLLLALLSFHLSAANIMPAPPQVAAKAYILIDANSGAALAEQNADMSLPPASLTKMMTSYVLSVELAAGRVDKSDMVTISEAAWAQNPVFNGSSLMWMA